MMQKYLLFLFALGHCFTTQSQSKIVTSGGIATGNGTVSYTVGQVTYNEYSNTSGSVSEGVQQAFEFQTLSNPELTTVNLKAVTYPNPTTDNVMLSITDSALTNISYLLIDVQGKVLSNGQVTLADTQIRMQHLATGMYVLKVYQNNKALKTFKIIKK
ncbi:T9SS type A sorting domain-containing protein [Winogradskyella sp.]|uniref:T9SS type A sorting domain-containing protein n=1 Tax=Winogradskyella sp. TaxID=1883156 RepID=UPI0035C8104C